MTANLNFEAESFNGFGPKSETPQEYEIVRDHRTGAAIQSHGAARSPAIGDHRIGAPGVVVRDHRPGAVSASVHGRPGFAAPRVVHGPAWRGATAFTRRVSGFAAPGIVGGISRFFHGSPTRASWNRGWYAGRPYADGARGWYGRHAWGDGDRFPHGDAFRHGFRSRWPWSSDSDYAGAAVTAGPDSDAVSGAGFDPPRVATGDRFSSSPQEDPQIVSWAQGCLAHVVGGWVPQDGNLSHLTRRAIQMFQTQMQIPPSGALDVNTLSALQKACETASANPPVPRPDPTAAVPPGPPPQMAAPPDTPPSPPAPTAADPAAGGAPSAPQPTQEFEAPDSPHEYGEYGGEAYEFEGPVQDQLCLDVPEAPYSDKWRDLLHRTIDAVEQVHRIIDVAGEEVAALLGVPVASLGVLIGGITALVAAPFIAIGAPYWEGRREESVKETRRGFANGVVTGAGGESWSLVKDRLWMKRPDTNYFDQGRANEGQKAYNLGLAAGFLCGKKLTQNLKKVQFIWDSIGAGVSQGSKVDYARTLQRYGPHSQSWPQRPWLDFYYAAAGSFTKLYLKE